ncbi:MAG: alkaline phosphatase family protein [Oleispira sp.]|nr:alkaline phosphatase family protein [Oleispira sp.]
MLLTVDALSASNKPVALSDIELPDAVAITGDKKVLLIGIDGLQFEELQKVSTPNFDRLTINKAYTGGITHSNSEQSTSSGPGWSTILTGVWANKHQITSNSSDLANPKFPSIFKRLRDAQPQAKIASIMNWGTPNTSYFRNDVTGNDIILNGLVDKDVTLKGVELIQQGYDLVFLHLDDPDHAGHSTGFGPAYNKSIQITDQYLGLLLNAVNQSHHDWLVLITTDHGRHPITGYGHGNQTKEEKTIFIGSNKTLNAEFTQPLSDLNNHDFNNLYGNPAQTSLTPTALRYLDIEIEKEWLLDGIPLVDNLGVRKLMPTSTGNNDIAWSSLEDVQIELYRNGQFLTQLNTSDQGWSDDTEIPGIFDYALVQNFTPAALRLNKIDINAAVSWGSSHAYLFRNDQRYVRYAKVFDKASPGYPKDTNNSSWPGFDTHADQLIAAFEKDISTSYYFFNNGHYIRYNNILDKAETGYPKIVNNDTWPGLEGYANKITAALRWNNNKVYFFLDNGQYIRFDLTNDRVDSGYPKAINSQTWPGLESYSMDITSAVKWNDNVAYIFLTHQRYLRYKLNSDQVDNGYPSKVNANTWSGLMMP